MAIPAVAILASPAARRGMTLVWVRRVSQCILGSAVTFLWLPLHVCLALADFV